MAHLPRLPAYRSIPRGAIRIDLPNTFQLKPYTCGPAALMAVFAFYGSDPRKNGNSKKRSCESTLPEPTPNI
jgi:hypothetical protein